LYVRAIQGLLKRETEGKKHYLISSSLNCNNLWQNCAYETAEHLGILNCLNWAFENLLGSWITASELSKKGKVKKSYEHMKSNM